MIGKLRINVKIFTDIVGKNDNAAFPDNNVYIQVYADTLGEAMKKVKEAVSTFASLNGVEETQVKYYIFGDSDAKKLQLAFNDFRLQNATTIRTMQDQIKFLMKLLAVPASAVYSDRRAP